MAQDMQVVRNVQLKLRSRTVDGRGNIVSDDAACKGCLALEVRPSPLLARATVKQPADSQPDIPLQAYWFRRYARAARNDETAGNPLVSPRMFNSRWIGGVDPNTTKRVRVDRAARCNTAMPEPSI
jgi:hypothetical protein